MSSSHRLPSHQQKQSVPDFRLHSLNQQKGTPEKKTKGTKRKELENKNTEASTIVNDTNICAHPPSLHKHRRREETRLQKKSLAFHRQKRSNQHKISVHQICFVRNHTGVSARTSQLSSYRHKRHSGVSKCRSPICLLMRSLLACCIPHPSKRKDKDKKKGKKNRRKEKPETHQLEKKTEVAQMQSSILCGETSHSKLICCSFKRIETKKRTPPLHAIANIEKT